MLKKTLAPAMAMLGFLGLQTLAAPIPPLPGIAPTTSSSSRLQPLADNKAGIVHSNAAVEAARSAWEWASAAASADPTNKKLAIAARNAKTAYLDAVRARLDEIRVGLSTTGTRLKAGLGTPAMQATFASLSAEWSELRAVLPQEPVSVRRGPVSASQVSKGAPPCTPLFEGFSSVTPPAIPAGWTSSLEVGDAVLDEWRSDNADSDSAPNSMFVPDNDFIADARLDSPPLLVGGGSAAIAFTSKYDLEPGFDGGVLEISLDGGPFRDILAAGATFDLGGYNATIDDGFSNPLSNRQAWSGTNPDSPDWVTTFVTLPASAAGKTAVFRWRLGTDSSQSGVGWRIDDVVAGGMCLTSPVVPTACVEDFDSVEAPAFPDGWTATTGTACGGPGAGPWSTTTSLVTSAPNNAFVYDPACVSDEYLDSAPISVPAGPGHAVTFQNYYDMEDGFDGGVLEISIDGGAFQDIVAAGGSFTSGGYNSLINTCCENPLGGRGAWSGNSGGYVTTTASLPSEASGESIVLRWRRGTDYSGSENGWRIDDVSYNFECPAVCPATSEITGITNVLVNDEPNTYSVTSPSATSYTWSVPNGATIESGDGTNSITVSFGPEGHSGTVQVYADTPCGTDFRSLDVTVGFTEEFDAAVPLWEVRNPANQGVWSIGGGAYTTPSAAVTGNAQILYTGVYSDLQYDVTFSRSGTAPASSLNATSIMFRHTNNGPTIGALRYRYSITREGRFSLWRMENDTAIVLINWGLVARHPSDHPTNPLQPLVNSTPGAQITVRVKAVGSLIELFMKSQYDGLFYEVGEATDANFALGRIGVIVNRSGAGLSDSFSVYRVQAGEADSFKTGEVEMSPEQRKANRKANRSPVIGTPDNAPRLR